MAKERPGLTRLMSKDFKNHRKTLTLQLISRYNQMKTVDKIDQEDLTFWSEYLVKWQKVWKKSPTFRTDDDELLRKMIFCRIEEFGIPHMLRGEVWPTLVSIDERNFEGLEKIYRKFGSQQSAFHDIIGKLSNILQVFITFSQ